MGKSFFIYEVVECNNEEYEDYREYSKGFYVNFEDAEKREYRESLKLETDDYCPPSIEIRKHKVIG